MFIISSRVSSPAGTGTLSVALQKVSSKQKCFYERKKKNAMWPDATFPGHRTLNCTELGTSCVAWNLREECVLWKLPPHSVAIHVNFCPPPPHPSLCKYFYRAILVNASIYLFLFSKWPKWGMSRAYLLSAGVPSLIWWLQCCVR